MKDPYSILGVSPGASDNEVKRAYRELARKYHPDNYQDNPLADLAEEKMKEVNEAYDAITRQRSGGEGHQSGGGATYQAQSGYQTQNYQRASADPFFAKVRQCIQAGNVEAAERMLTQEATTKNAEWYFLMGAVCYRRGWLDEARQNYQMAAQMEPGNMEYRQAYAMMSQGGVSYRPSGYRSSASSGCDDCCSAYLCFSCLTPWGGPCC
ncbi:MAG: DnaJ domain-containing protein [Oscillospiraceae bacterium]|jgi:hypothetical protein